MDLSLWSSWERLGQVAALLGNFVGAAAFGALIGWYVYYINRYRSGDVQFSDLTTVVGIIGGAAVTGLFPTEGPRGYLFGAYGIGLALGFFAYLKTLKNLVAKSQNFDDDWFLDGRRRDPQPPYGIPGEARPTRAAMDEPSGSSAGAAALAGAAAAAAVAALRDDRRGAAPPRAAAVAQADAERAPTSPEAQRLIDVCEDEWPANRSNCSALVKDVAGRVGVALTGQADDILDQTKGPGWTPVADGVNARTLAEAGMLVIAGLKGGDHSPPRANGHVAIVVAGPLAHGRYPTAYWGSLNGVGERRKTLNFAWRVADRDKVAYAARAV